MLNGDVLTDLDVGMLVATHERTGAEGTIALHRVDDPSAFGVVPTDDDGRVTAFIEKPPPRRGAHRPHQRRRLRARAVGARADPAGRARERRAGHLPGHGGRRLALRRRRRHLLDRCRHPGDLPGRQPRPAQRSPRRRSRRACTPTPRSTGRSSSRWSAPARTSSEGAVVSRSVVLAGRRRRRRGPRAGCHHRRPGPSWAPARCSKRAPSWAMTSWCRPALS